MAFVFVLDFGLVEAKRDEWGGRIMGCRMRLTIINTLTGGKKTWDNAISLINVSTGAPCFTAYGSSQPFPSIIKSVEGKKISNPSNSWAVDRKFGRSPAAWLVFLYMILNKFLKHDWTWIESICEKLLPCDLIKYRNLEDIGVAHANTGGVHVWLSVWVWQVECCVYNDNMPRNWTVYPSPGCILKAQVK